MSFLRDYEQTMAQYTDAPPIYHAANAAALLGACLTRKRYRCQIAFGIPARWTNLWMLIVGDSGQSRKTTTVVMAAEVLSRAMPELRTPDDGSPEGYAKDFVQRDARDAGDAAGLLVQTEMGQFLMNVQKDYARALKGMMMDFYDVPTVYKRKLSKEEFQVTKPRFSMLGAVATELLPSLTTSEDWLGGFMNRAMLINGVREGKEREHVTAPPEEIYRDLSNTLLATLGEWRKTRMREQKKLKLANENDSSGAPQRKTFLFDFDADALKEMKHLRKAHKEHSDPNVRLLLGRATTHLTKLAAIEQISMDATSATITKAAVRNAWPLYDAWYRGAPAIMELAFARSNTDVEGDRIPRKILKNLTVAGPRGMYEDQLMRATILSWDHFNKGLASLLAAGMVDKLSDGDGKVRVVLKTYSDEAPPELTGDEQSVSTTSEALDSLTKGFPFGDS